MLNFSCKYDIIFSCVSNGYLRYIGILLVTNSTKVADSGEPLNVTARKIYYDAQLGNVHCDNGLLIIYIKDKKQVTIANHF